MEHASLSLTYSSDGAQAHSKFQSDKVYVYNEFVYEFN